MAATATKRAATTPRKPEHKLGPFHGGLGVAIWLNEVQTDAGLRFFRSVTISPRRFLDPKTDEWKDASSLRTTDLPVLILALQASLQFMTSTPLPGQPAEEEQPDPAAPSDNGNIPF
jgi:hypothetical protein